MTYLYGDATPFPLEENFIETLSAATNACVALFRIDRELDERRQRAAAIRTRSAEEVIRLEALCKTLEAALAPMFPAGEPEYVAQRKALEINQLARASIEQTRVSLIRDSESAATRTIGQDLSSRVLDALGAFLLRHQLPGTSWHICWRYQPECAAPELSLRAAVGCGLTANFTGQLPLGHRWSSPVRISELMADTKISIRRDGSWLGRLFKGAHEDLTSFYITAVQIHGEDARFEVHRHLKQAADGYLIRVRGSKLAAPLIHPLAGPPQGTAGTAAGDVEPIPVQEDEIAGLMGLWRSIEQDMRALQSMRERVVSATLRNANVTQLEEPAELAELILGTLAPIVREMRLRSRVPGELVLKRDLGNGRREELFVSRRDLEDKFGTLPYEQQVYFQSAGLGSEATMEFSHGPPRLVSPPGNATSAASGAPASPTNPNRSGNAAAA